MEEAVLYAQMNIIKYLEPLMTPDEMGNIFNVNRMPDDFIPNVCKNAIQKGDIKFFEYLENQYNQFNKDFDAWGKSIKPIISSTLKQRYAKREYPFTEPSTEMVTYLNPYLHAELKSKLYPFRYDSFLSALIMHKLKNIPEKLSTEDCEIYAYLHKSRKTTDDEFFDFPITDVQKKTLLECLDFKEYQESLKDCKDEITKILKSNIQRIRNTDSYWNLFFSNGAAKINTLETLISNVKESLTMTDIRELLKNSLDTIEIKKARSILTQKNKSIQAIEDCISTLENIQKKVDYPTKEAQNLSNAP